MSITEVTITCDKRIEITDKGLSTGMDPEEVVAWCGANGCEYSYGDSQNADNECITIDCGELEILYNWNDGTFLSVTIRRDLEETTGWDNEGTDWPNNPGGKMQQPASPTPPTICSVKRLVNTH